MQEGTSFFSVRNKKTHQLVEEQIRASIFKQQYRPGEKLPTERELSMMFNASQASVREALHSLEKSGLIVKKRGMHGGSFVTTSDSAPVVNSFVDTLQLGNVNLDEIRQARLAFEPFVAFEAAKKAKKKDIERLKRIHGRHASQLLTETDEIVYDRSLHNALVEITGNRVFIIIMKVLADVHAIRTNHIELDSKAKRALINQHGEIIEQIEKHNPEMAAKMMEKHIQLIQKELSRLEKETNK